MATPIQFANGPLPQAPNTTLTSTIPSTGAATPTVASAAFLPAVGPFLIVVDTERIMVDSISGTTLTILSGGRAQEGTSAVAHSSGAAIYQVLSAATLARTIDDRAAKGRLGLAQATANQGSITTEVDLTGISVTCDVGDGTRQIRVVFDFARLSTTINDGTVRLTMYIDGTTQIRSRDVACNANAVAEGGGAMTWVGQPSAGSHTFKVTCKRNSGTGVITVVGAATDPMQLLVEDIGAV